MIDQWPWFVMVIGVVALFAYRYWSSNKGRYLHAPSDFKDESELFASTKAATKTVSDRASVGGISKRKSTISPMVHEWMPVVISLLVLLSALFVILSNNNFADAQQKWAFGVVGTILGYWFKK
jgi:hypothetical protein